MSRLVGLLILIASTALTSSAAPTLSLVFFEIDSDRAIASGSVVTIPAGRENRFELRIEDAFTDVQAASVKVALNDVPLTIFSRTNRLPTGVRVLVDLNRSLNNEYRFQVGRANTLTIYARDEAGNRYSGSFEVAVSPDSPDGLVSVDEAGRKAIFAPKERFSGPEVKFDPNLPRTVEFDVQSLVAEVHDQFGLREVTVAVNGKNVETVLIENGTPVRKRGAFYTTQDLPGLVNGDANRLRLDIPVKLTKATNVVVLQAVNAKGVQSRSTWTVNRVKRR